ncbi:MAG: hypothetical protein ABDH59_07425 [Fervidobacterium sp.]
MITLNVANDARTRLASDLNADATTLSVVDASKFPDPPFICVIYLPDRYEIVIVTAKNGNIWTVERGKENTTPQSWPAGTPIELRWTAGTYEMLKQTINQIIQTIEEMLG